MRLSVMVTSGKKELYLKTPLVITTPSEIILKSATVFWDFNNIDNDVEDFISVDGTRVEFEHGYWTFDDLETKLKKEGVTLVKERVTGKCTLSVNDITYFKTLGVLLGLNDYTNMDAGSTMMSHSKVDINRGFKSLDIKCNIVDKSKNIDSSGGYSDVIASLPIPTDRTLKGSLSHYSDINSKVKLNRGTYNFLEFEAFSNISRYAGDVLLEMYISPK